MWILQYSFYFIIQLTYITKLEERSDLFQNRLVVDLDLVDSLDYSVSPCDDFYLFACNKWSQKHHNHKSTFSLSRSVFNRRIETILNEIPHFPFVFPHVSNCKNLEVARHFYRQCTHFNSNTGDSSRHLIQFIRTVIPGWLMGTPTNHSAQWSQLYLDSLLNAGVAAVLDIDVDQNGKNHSKQLILRRTYVFGKNTDVLFINNSSWTNHYYHFIRKSFKLFRLSSEDMLDADVKQIVNLEQRLHASKFDVASITRENSSNLQILQQTNLMAKLIDKLSARLNTPINQSAVHVEDFVFFKLWNFVETIKILDNTKPDLLNKYFGWSIMNKYGPLASKQMLLYKQEMLERIGSNDGLVESVNHCSTVVSDLMPIALLRAYVDRYLSVGHKLDVVRLAQRMQQSVKQIVLTKTWLSDELKARAISQVQNISLNIAYPDWLMDDNVMEFYYGMHQPHLYQTILSQKYFLKSQANYVRGHLRWKLLNLSQSNTVLLRATSLRSLNAAYNYGDNSITIPVTMLTSPFYSLQWSGLMKYSTIGFIIAHELTHSLAHAIGDKADGTSSQQYFTSNTNCFVDQYQNLSGLFTSQKIDGQLTLVENIADNGALTIAYQLFQSQLSAWSPSLTPISIFNHEQRFFIALAQTNCGGGQGHGSHLNSHAPVRARINAVLQNFVPFSRAFQCPVHSPMNPSRKCSLW